MNFETKVLLIDLANKINQAVITDDDKIAGKTIDYLASALASVTPSDNSAARIGVRALPSDAGSARRHAKYKALSTQTITIVRASTETRTFFAEAEWECTGFDGSKSRNKQFREGYVADVFEMLPNFDRRTICKIEFPEEISSQTAIRRILRGVLKGVCSHYGANNRKKANKRARKAAQKEVA